MPSHTNTQTLSPALRMTAMVVMGKLRAVLEAPETTRRLAETVKLRLDRIEEAKEFLSDDSHIIAFVGQVGAGKSAMISVISRLLVDGEPDDKKSLKASSVLSVGAGRTTVCEVRIRAATATERGRVGMMIEPCTVEEMKDIISDFARDEWARRRDATLQFDDANDTSPTPKEVRRVIRSMTNTNESYRSVVIDGRRKEVEDDPIDDLVKNHDSPGSFANYMVERAGLLTRQETEWWWQEGDGALGQLKRRFDDVNNGRAPNAMLPQSITLVVQTPLPDSLLGLDLQLIDTRGFDGNLESRPDIQAVLKDPRCLVVSCTSFKDAPSEGLRSLLGSIATDASLRPSLSRMLLVLMDHDDAEHVNEAAGDRRRGQAIKCRECAHTLEFLGHGTLGSDDTLVAFDTIHDPRERLIEHLDGRLRAIRHTVRDTLDREVQDATTFLEQIKDRGLEAARADIDRQLRLTMSANLPTGLPLRDPLAGLYAAVNGCRYASQVQASNTRNGRYWALNAYAAVRSGAAKEITSWLNNMVSAIRYQFRSLEADPELTEVSAHLRLRQSQFEEGLVRAVNGYADAVQGEVEGLLECDNDLWRSCREEWGRGPGFKFRVIDHLTSWSSRQRGLGVHRSAEPAQVLPLPNLDDEADGQ